MFLLDIFLDTCQIYVIITFSILLMYKNNRGRRKWYSHNIFALNQIYVIKNYVIICKFTPIDKITKICYNGRSPFRQHKGARERSKHMKIYTIDSTLVAINKDGEEKILDHHSQDFAYKTLETAYKALEQLKKVFIADCGYEATRSEFLIIKRRSYEDGNLYENRFEIKEHYISEFED